MSVFSCAASCDLTEIGGKVFIVFISYHFGNFIIFVIGMVDKLLCLFDSELMKILFEGVAGYLIKKAAEVTGGEVNDVRNVWYWKLL